VQGNWIGGAPSHKALDVGYFPEYFDDDFDVINVCDLCWAWIFDRKLSSDDKKSIKRLKMRIDCQHIHSHPSYRYGHRIVLFEKYLFHIDSSSREND
jgi:hypothetical protein